MMELGFEEEHYAELYSLITGTTKSWQDLLTFNVRHFTPTSPKITVQPPSGFLLTVRSLLGMLENVKK